MFPDDSASSKEESRVEAADAHNLASWHREERTEALEGLNEPIPTNGLGFLFCL
jgi:hypothetical protein